MLQVDRDKIFCWISNLEIALEDLQRRAAAIFVNNSDKNRSTLLELIISQRQLWGDRPTDEIQKLIEGRQP